MIATAAKVLPPGFAAELERLAAQPVNQLSAIREFVADPGLPSWAVDTIQQILNDEDHLAEIAHQSFAHPNGFDSIPLENSHPSHRVRLHVWWPEAPLLTEDIHNHAWSFGSRLLSGALNFQTYRQSDEGSPYLHYPWQLGGSFAYDNSAVTTVKLAPVLNATFAENTYYTFDLTELHRVAPVKTQRPVSTLVIIGSWQRDGSDVYTEKPRHGEGYRPLKNPYPPRKLAERLRRYLDSL
ncbi:hypothetical protein [Micromonospora sp. M71_S20]|uniref:hypothetical protein n=2 Tax=Micromonospora sp. M71_S20 TaxID=592872 RepID=UPI000EAE922A|nr:hypothetical protein [Micromonospora sp. M71_S20]